MSREERRGPGSPPRQRRGARDDLLALQHKVAGLQLQLRRAETRNALLRNHELAVVTSLQHLGCLYGAASTSACDAAAAAAATAAAAERRLRSPRALPPCAAAASRLSTRTCSGSASPSVTTTFHLPSDAAAAAAAAAKGRRAVMQGAVRYASNALHWLQLGLLCPLQMALLRQLHPPHGVPPPGSFAERVFERVAPEMVPSSADEVLTAYKDDVRCMSVLLHQLSMRPEAKAELEEATVAAMARLMSVVAHSQAIFAEAGERLRVAPPGMSSEEHGRCVATVLTDELAPEQVGSLLQALGAAETCMVRSHGRRAGAGVGVGAWDVGAAGGDAAAAAGAGGGDSLEEGLQLLAATEVHQARGYASTYLLCVHSIAVVDAVQAAKWSVAAYPAAPFVYQALRQLSLIKAGQQQGGGGGGAAGIGLSLRRVPPPAMLARRGSGAGAGGAPHAPL